MNIGTLAGWSTFVVLVVVGTIIWRGGGGTALGVLRTANEVLEERIAALTKQVAQQQVLITDLQSRTDVTIALTPLIGALVNHEQRESERWLEMAKILHAISAKLGADSAL